MTPTPRSNAEILEKTWKTEERWQGIVRNYSADDVVQLRGSLMIEHTLDWFCDKCSRYCSRFARGIPTSSSLSCWERRSRAAWWRTGIPCTIIRIPINSLSSATSGSLSRL